MHQPFGQHWLFDETALQAVVDAANVVAGDTVLEIGPGQGTLTAQLLKRAGRVVAIELDRELIPRLRRTFTDSKFELIEGDILDYDYSNLPVDYKVAANLPYYITAPILQRLIYSQNPPFQMGLLVQKEVAERICASPGQLSVLAVSVQNRYETMSREVVLAKMFSPPPKVDSQVVSLVRRVKPQFGPEEQAILKLVKTGFANRRKTLVNSLSAGLLQDKTKLTTALRSLNLSELVRAQELTLPQWRQLHQKLYS